MRVTAKDLVGLCDVLNVTVKAPEGCGQKVDGRFVWNLDHFMVEQSFGGCSLVRVMTHFGATRQVFDCGHTTRSRLYDLMTAYVKGIRYGKEL